MADSRGEDQRFYIIVQGSAKLFKTAVVPQADGTVVEGAEEELVSAPDVQLGVGDYFAFEITVPNQPGHAPGPAISLVASILTLPFWFWLIWLVDVKRYYQPNSDPGESHRHYAQGAHADGELVAGSLADVLQHLAHRTDAVFEGASVLVVAPVQNRGEEGAE